MLSRKENKASPGAPFPETPESHVRTEGNPLSQVWFQVKFNTAATEELRSQTSRPSHPTMQHEPGQLLGPLPPSRTLPSNPGTCHQI